MPNVYKKPFLQYNKNHKFIVKNVSDTSFETLKSITALLKKPYIYLNPNMRIDDPIIKKSINGMTFELRNIKTNTPFSTTYKINGGILQAAGVLQINTSGTSFDRDAVYIARTTSTITIQEVV